MTSEKSSAAAYREKILEEHRLITELTGSITSAGTLDEIAAGLGKLQPLLESHFDREEGQEGLHVHIRDRAPQFDAAVKRLVEDHRTLLHEVRDLQTRVAQGSAGSILEIRKGWETLVAHLEDHEARENEVFLDTWTDLGTGD